MKNRPSIDGLFFYVDIPVESLARSAFPEKRTSMLSTHYHNIISPKVASELISG